MTTLPLSPEDMVAFFKDKTQPIEIDFEGSLKNLNEKSMLVYLANLGINCSFNKINDSLLKEYITLNEFTNIIQLQVIHANLLHNVKYHAPLYQDYLELFTPDQMTIFAQQNIDVISEQLVFLDSMLLYTLTRKDEICDNQTYSNNVFDGRLSSISFSLVKLLSLSDFLICQMKEMPDVEDQTYFSQYFDEYMFNGQALFHYASKSAFLGLMSMVQNANDNTDIKDDLNKLNQVLDYTYNYYIDNNEQ